MVVHPYIPHADIILTTVQVFILLSNIAKGNCAHPDQTDKCLLMHNRSNIRVILASQIFVKAPHIFQQCFSEHSKTKYHLHIAYMGTTDL